MTKERKLAIDMWLWIRARYDEWEAYFWRASVDDGLAKARKYRFIEEENGGKILKWKGMCWLRNYMRSTIPTSPEELRSCGGCPLKSCGAPLLLYNNISRTRL